jgi:predicted nucleic acid-binding protein
LKYQALVNVSLDLGESSAIALAIEYKEPLLILDDLKARNFAESLNIPYTGTIGILLNAQKKEIIKNLKEVLSLIKRTDFRLSEELIDLALKLSGEK